MYKGGFRIQLRTEGKAERPRNNGEAEGKEESDGAKGVKGRSAADALEVHDAGSVTTDQGAAGGTGEPGGVECARSQGRQAEME